MSPMLFKVTATPRELESFGADVEALAVEREEENVVLRADTSTPEGYSVPVRLTISGPPLQELVRACSAGGEAAILLAASMDGSVSELDRFNHAATFEPQTIADVGSRPCLGVGGVQVNLFVDEGANSTPRVWVSVYRDDAATELVDDRGEVPICIKVDDSVVWE